MKKVLILANSSSGLYDFRNGLVLQMLQEGIEVVASLPDDAATKELSEEGVRVVHIEMNRRGMNPKQDLQLIKSYKELLRQEQPDLVLTYTIKPNIYGGYLCRRLRIPYITTITGLGSAFEREGFMKKMITGMYRAGLKGCSCVFFQNAENRQIFRNLGIVGQKDTLVGGSGVDLERHVLEAYPGHEGTTTKFTYIGRLMQEKGTDELLQAAEILHEKYGDQVSFETVGYTEGDYEQKVQALAEKGYFHIVGYQKEIHPYMQASDCVVMPSWHEGMSNVLMEAAATGRPTIASDISGCRELIEDGVSGYLFPAKNAGALAQAMERFVGLSIEQRREMGLAGRAKMEREFDRHSIIDGYMLEIRSVLDI